MTNKPRWIIRATGWGFSLYESGDLIASADKPDSLIYGSNMLFGLGGQG